MNRMLSFLLALSPIIAAGPSTEEIFQTPSPAALEEARAFVSSLGNPTEAPPQKCSANSSLFSPSTSIEHPASHLRLFMSLSVPLQSWKEHSYALQKLGGAFVLRGLHENSFAQFSKKIIELRKAGILADILLDPPAFDKYEIASVPAFVLESGDRYDKVMGNIPVSVALILFAEKGETHEVAQQLLKQAEAP